MAAPATYTSASLYVGNLHPDVTEAKLFETFNPIGSVVSIRVCRDKITRRSLCYAYVNFHQHSDAERALELLNFTPINGQECRIMWSQRDPSVRRSGQNNIFIKNLEESIDSKTLLDTFSRFGNILSCKVAMDETGKSKGYGFVHFELAEAAEKAIEQVDKKYLKDKQVSVSKYIPRKERQEQQSANQAKFTNVFVKCTKGNFSDDFAGNQELHEFFSRFGKVQSCVVMKDEEGKNKGFGFVDFENHEDAAKAVDELNGKEVAGKTLYVTRAQKKAERQAEIKLQRQQRKREQASKYMGVNLYIKNLSEVPINPTELANASPEEQKQIIGERLFFKIEAINAEQAGKITGMLLEMDNSELLILLDSPETLKAKVKEAEEVLSRHQAEAEPEAATA
eukprot:Colp12_sorted_trinity150504_noHs@23892